mmetsp:Transcript_3769/g.3210  ORF Transcript_3769/g.3210 Transcript_3769/m.3210 type:complete len:150 (+) Transcript_3769:46-495(+)
MPHLESPYIPMPSSAKDDSYGIIPKAEELTLVKSLGTSKFSVFVAQSNDTNSNFAIKLFQFSGPKLNPYYCNEKRFAEISHKNIITMVDTVDKTEIVINQNIIRGSYILYEYAPLGNFHDIIYQEKLKFDEKLARTFFHHLISGLSYLH